MNRYRIEFDLKRLPNHTAALSFRSPKVDMHLLQGWLRRLLFDCDMPNVPAVLSHSVRKVQIRRPI